MNDIVSHLDIETEGAAMLVLAGVDMMFKAKAKWLPEDVAILREHYPAGGIAAVRPHLPHKTDESIYWKAGDLKLRSPARKGRPPAPRYLPSPYIDDAIRRYYAGSPRKGGLTKLAHQVRRTAEWVSARARQLGVVQPRFKEPAWSSREIELLRQHAYRVPRTIARQLRREGFKRTEAAIIVKRTRIHCDCTDDGHYSGRGLAALFGVQARVVFAWIDKGWLKAKTRGTAHEHDHYRISQAAVRRFVIDNAGAVDIKRVDKIWFIDLLAGEG